MNDMKTRFLFLAIALLAHTAFGATVNFDDAAPGGPPSGWTATKTGDGQPKWTVEKDDTAPSKPNVLKQSGVAAYPICLKNGSNLNDGVVEVKFKPISGEDDQAAGLIWRVRDANNYYTARANSLENNVTIYHTVNGKRTEKKRVKVTVPRNQWQTLRVEFSGNRFVVSLEGKKTLEWEDSTFPDAGKVGLWTKADSVTLFDDFNYGTN